MPFCEVFGADISVVERVSFSDQAFDGLYQAWLDCGAGRVTVVFAPSC